MHELFFGIVGQGTGPQSCLLRSWVTSSSNASAARLLDLSSSAAQERCQYLTRCSSLEGSMHTTLCIAPTWDQAKRKFCYGNLTI